METKEGPCGPSTSDPWCRCSPTPPAAVEAAWRRVEDAKNTVLCVGLALAVDALLAARRACVAAGYREVWLAPETVKAMQLYEETDETVAAVRLVARDLATVMKEHL